MRALRTKLRRDLWALRGPALAIALVVAAGLSVFAMALSTLRSLEAAQEAYYEGQRFADVFVALKRAPLALGAQLSPLPGVAAVELRVGGAARLHVPGLAEPASARVLSLPDAGRPALNRPHLRRGRWPEPGAMPEVLASEAFAEANALRPGSTLDAVVEGRNRLLRVVGVALSPEFVYCMPPGLVLPDDRRHGVLWALRADVEQAYDLDGAFNDACLRLAPGASERAVIDGVERLLAPYGSLGAHGRGEQPSHRFLTQELEELRTMAVVPPGIFLLVAAFLLHMALGRLIGTQREQIAVLKAFGYRDAEVGRHYLGLALAIVVPGVVAGLAAGTWLGEGLTQRYARFFRFPVLEHALPADVAVLSAAIAFAAALAGTLGAVRRVVRLPPAEAMRPEAPARYRRLAFERLGLGRLVGSSGRMVLRHLARHPVRALLSALSIALAAAILILGSFAGDAVESVVDLEFQLARRQDRTVVFTGPAPASALHDVRALPGVRRAEPFRSVPVRLSAGHHERRLSLTGLLPDGELEHPRDADGRAVTLPPEGVLLAEALAEILEVAPGEHVRVEELEGERRRGRLLVTGVVSGASGLGAWMALPALSRWLGEEGALSGALLLTDPASEARLDARLREAPAVVAAPRRTAALASFRATIGESMRRMRLVNVVFAVILAVGAVYNAARVSLAERSRELATLRVLGFTRAEVGRLLTGELAVLALAGLPAGLLLGRGLAALTVRAFETEVFRFPLLIAPSTYGFAALVTLLAAGGALLLVRRRLRTLDLLAVLKAKE